MQQKRQKHYMRVYKKATKEVEVIAVSYTHLMPSIFIDESRAKQMKNKEILKTNIQTAVSYTHLLVKQTGTEVNLEVECKSHINIFHTLFFSSIICYPI